MSAPATTLDRTVAPGAPRPYQIDAMKAAWLAWNGERRPTGTGPVDRILITMATGGGKTFIFTRLAKEFLDAGQKVIILVHREDLAVQAFNHMHSAAPGADVGMVMGSMFNDVDADIIVASVPTLVNPRRLEQITPRGLIIPDEAHLSAAPGWYSVIEGLGGFDGRAKVAGFTATPYREDGKPLVGGRRPIFQENVFTWDIVDGIRSGWLCDLDAYQWKIKSLDLLKVSEGRGEMSAEDLGDALMNADAGPEIVAAYLDPEKGGLREDGSFRPGLLFTPNVETAYRFAEDFNAAGIPAETVTGETPGQCKERAAGRPGDCCGVCRQAIYDRFRAGITVVLVNCMVLTVGFDMPPAEVCLIARPTTSKGLYRQMVGRITRKFAGSLALVPKVMGRIIDVVGVTDRLDLASPADVIGAPVEEGETLKEAVERKERQEPEEGFEVSQPEREKGDLVAEAVNLFEQSSSMFLQSPLGYWFVPVSEAIYYLQPLSGGLFSVCRLPKGGKRIRKVRGVKVTDAQVLESKITEEWGKAWIETYARNEDPSISSKSAAWRSKKDPTIAQVEFLEKRGYDYPEDFETRSEASNLMSQIIAGWQGL
jgi:superfamily II DNA or RNA helicase